MIHLKGGLSLRLSVFVLPGNRERWGTNMDRTLMIGLMAFALVLVSLLLLLTPSLALSNNVSSSTLWFRGHSPMMGTAVSPGPSR